MASFNITTEKSSLYLTCTYTVGTGDPATNKTPVEVNLTLHHGGLYVTAGTNDCSVTIGSNAVRWTGPDISSGSAGSVDLGTKTIYVQHNADGTFNGTITASYKLGVTYGGTYIGTISGFKAITIPALAQVSSFSVSGTTLGGSMTVSITRYVSTHTHTVKLTFNGNTVTHTNVATSDSISLPIAWCSTIPNATKGSATVTVTTYNGDSKVGSLSKAVSLSVPASVVPTVSLSVSGVDPFDGQYILQNVTGIAYSASGAGVYGSTIKSWYVQGGGYSANNQSGTFAASKSSGNITFTATVTDSRGRQASATATLAVTSYSTPTINVSDYFRCGSDGAYSATGGYLNAKADYTVSGVGGANTGTCRVYYRETGATSWSGSTVIAKNTSTVVFNNNLQADKTYEFRFRVTDTVGKTATSIVSLNMSNSYPMTAVPGKVGVNGYLDKTKTDGVQIFGDLHLMDGSVAVFSERGAAGVEFRLGKNMALISGITNSTTSQLTIVLPYNFDRFVVTATPYAVAGGQYYVEKTGSDRFTITQGDTTSRRYSYTVIGVPA